MKLKTLLLTTALVTSAAFNAFADAGAPVEKKHHKHNKMEGYYGVAEVGATFPLKIKTNVPDKLKYKSANFVGGLGVGYEVNEFIRSDLRIQYRDFGAKNTKLTATGYSGKVKSKAWTAMLNGYVDGHNDTIFTPYVMAGIGAGHVKSKVTFTGTVAANATESGNAKRFGFVWNAGLGVMAKATDQLSFDLAYRFTSFTKVGTTKQIGPVGVNSWGKIKLKALHTNDVTIGAIWHF